MLPVIGWIAWAGVVYLALTFAYRCRKYAAAKQGFQWATGVQTFFWWLIGVVFLLTQLNKLHIIWLVPVGFFGAQFIALGGIPVVSPLVLLATRAFLRLILIGAGRHDRQAEGAQQRPTKTEFIKSLLRQRLEGSGVFSQWRAEFNQMTDAMVMGIPEAAIVTIVETYTQFRSRPGWADEAIFDAIERHRSAFTLGGQLPSPLTLTGYVSYRLELEHGHGDLRLTDEVTANAVRQSLVYFGG
jgi:hypothetical protein